MKEYNKRAGAIPVKWIYIALLVISAVLWILDKIGLVNIDL